MGWQQNYEVGWFCVCWVSKLWALWERDCEEVSFFLLPQVACVVVAISYRNGIDNIVYNGELWLLFTIWNDIVGDDEHSKNEEIHRGMFGWGLKVEWNRQRNNCLWSWVSGFVGLPLGELTKPSPVLLLWGESSGESQIITFFYRSQQYIALHFKHCNRTCRKPLRPGDARYTLLWASASALPYSTRLCWKGVWVVTNGCGTRS